MDTTKLITILQLANEMQHNVIAKEAVASLAKEYGLALVPFYASLSDIKLHTPMRGDNRIACIKELREKAADSGLDCGLREAKEEIDRRWAIVDAQNTIDSWRP